MVRYTVISCLFLMSRIGPQSQDIAIIEGPNDGKIYSISLFHVSHWTLIILFIAMETGDLA